ncbi:31297_t:CDS:2 [Gigaspora margarita]|uniref:31297_t:CDS:1 n=1 Tax=Gigaspora margarita TaxID=4874 RepID=A0ABN7V0R8_GIGMA|nr:31297_t:CDS:2 [Gigaspora margarita]
MRKVTERKDIQEETECVEIPFRTKQTEYMILDIHVDNKNDNIKENPYQHKEVAVNIIHIATENQEIMYNPLQMDQMLLDIDTVNTKNFIPVLPIRKKLTRITVGDNQKEDLKIRKQHRLTLHGLPENIAEVLLLHQVRYLKAKAVYIPQSELRKLLAILEIFSRYKSEIKEKKTTRVIKKNENRTTRKTLELGNYTTMKSKWKHTGKENDNTIENLNTRRMTHKNNLSNENEERSGYPKNESLNAILQEILNRLEKIESSYSSNRAIATPDTKRVHEKTQGTHSWGVGPNRS